MLYALRQDIYEKGVGDAYPVVRHTFFGKTKAEAQGYYNAHMTTDQFMRDCTERGQWDQVICTPKEAGEPIADVPPIRGSICISETQRKVHIGGEVAALALVVPFMAYLTTRKQLPTWARAGAGTIGAISLLLDGYLLVRFLKR